MIVVNGSRFDPGQAAPNPPLTENCLTIAGNMNESAESFAYSSYKQLGFELYLRDHIVKAAKALNSGRTSFASFAKDRCNPEYWERTEEGGFKLKSSQSSSQAVRDIFQQGELYSFECATAIVIIYYKAVLESIGEASFNRLFTNIYLHDWQYDKDLGLRIVYPEEAIPGDVKYFDNPDVDPKHMVWQGENTVYVGGGKFFGHGIGITTGEKIITHLNKYRKRGSTKSATLLKQTTRPDFSYLLQFSDDFPDVPLQFSGTGTIRKREFMTVTIGTKTYAVSHSPENKEVTADG